MKTGEITFLGLWAAIVGLIAIFDGILNDRYKEKVFAFLAALGEVEARPFSWAFYSLMTMMSGTFTLFILACTGALQRLTGEGSFIEAIKSSGPLFIAIVLKVLLVDFMLALKTVVLIRGVAGDWRRNVARRRISKIEIGLVLGMVALLDLWFSAWLIKSFLYWMQNLQSAHLAKAEGSAILRPVLDFFDSVNLMIKESISLALYALNGTFAVYLTFPLLRAAKKAVNPQAAKQWQFRAIAGLLTILMFAIVLAWSKATAP